MKFARWFLKKVDRLTENILEIWVGVLATIGAISVSDVRTGVVMMIIIVMLMYLERN